MTLECHTCFTPSRSITRCARCIYDDILPTSDTCTHRQTNHCLMYDKSLYSTHNFRSILETHALKVCLQLWELLDVKWGNVWQVRWVYNSLKSQKTSISNSVRLAVWQGALFLCNTIFSMFSWRGPPHLTQGMHKISAYSLKQDKKVLNDFKLS